MTKALFAVCPMVCARRTLRHTANYRFPVVGAVEMFVVLMYVEIYEQNGIFVVNIYIFGNYGTPYIKML